MFNDADLKQISDNQLVLETINYQLDKFKSGFPPAVLSEPATVGKGIHELTDQEVDGAIDFYDKNKDKYDIVKFVPASGAATRMFKSLFAFLSTYSGSDADYEALKGDQSQGSIYTFFKELDHFAFYEDLKDCFQSIHGKSLEEAQLKREYSTILETLLNDPGLEYGSLPKGLLKFHRYEMENRTPVEEHIVEGAQYAKGQGGAVKIHFTVSPDHLAKFKKHVAEVGSRYEKKYGVKLEVSYSIQKTSTDTIAVDLNNVPFRNDDGSILFRPAGHGALLENLNDIEADIVFLKNIDNVVPDSLKAETIRYKKAIAGVLLEYQGRIKEALSDIENDKFGDAEKLIEELGFRPSASYQALSNSEKRTFLNKKLTRPFRVCGMVQSDGDPGGGPFWIEATDGSKSLQIVETAQIDLSDEAQKKVFNQATYFNPVDVVCLLKSPSGAKYDLMKHRDPETGFVTQKSKDGKDLKAQELPGLWNGAMADWNTVLVNVPPVTFNPVKSVNDLLKPEHQ